MLCDAEVPNELCNLPASKAKLPYTECTRAFNRFGPNTMTCSNVSVKQYWYFRYFIKVPNGPRSRRAEQEEGARMGDERGGMWSRRGS